MKSLFSKKNILILLGLGIVVLIIGNQLSKKDTLVEESEYGLKTVTTRLFTESSHGEQTLEFIGTVKSTQSLDLVPEAGGRIIRIESTEGSSIKKGQSIAVIDNAHEQLAYQRALANLESQNLVLNNLRKEFNQADSSTYSQLVSQQEKSVEAAYQAFLNNDLQAYPFDKSPESVDALAPIVSGTYQGLEEGQYILEMYPSVASSGYSLRVSGIENGIYSASTQFPTPLGEKGLYLQFPVSGQGTIREQKWVIDIPNTRSSSYLSAKNAYEATQSGKSLTLTQSKVTAETLAQQENVVRQMNLAVQEASLMLSKKILRAPFDGEITRLDVRVGDSVNPGNIIGTFKNLDALELEFFVSPFEASMISLGTSLVLDDTVIGNVFSVASTLDTNGKIKVKASLDDGQFIEGSSLRFSLSLDENLYEVYEGSTIIPLTALQMRGNQSFIATLDDEQRVVFVPVRTGLLFGDMIEISFEENISLLILDVRGLRSGEKVMTQITL